MEEVGQKVTVMSEVDRDELWSAIMGSGFDTFNWWQGMRFEDASWESPGVVGTVTMRVEDPKSGGTLSKTIDMKRLLVAISYAIEKGYRDPLVPDGTIGMAVASMDFDAVTGDIVMQCAVFGDVVYG